MNDHSKSEDNLLPIPLRDEPGVLRSEIDSANHAVMIDFDPHKIEDATSMHCPPIHRNAEH